MVILDYDNIGVFVAVDNKGAFFVLTRLRLTKKVNI